MSPHSYWLSMHAPKTVQAHLGILRMNPTDQIVTNSVTEGRQEVSLIGNLSQLCPISGYAKQRN